VVLAFFTLRTASVFFLRTLPMSGTKPMVAQEIAEATMAFQRQCTEVTPASVTVVLGEKTLVVTLHEALSPAEKEMARTTEGAARVHEYHRQLFHDSAGTLHKELNRILGVEVSESTVDMQPPTGRVAEVFSTGDMVQVFRLSRPVATQTWSTPTKEIVPPTA
jgi:uncharacterized protein YbcI